jgi:CBS domain-containing protein
MTTQPLNPTKRGWLKVRLRRVAESSLDPSELTVYCPPQGQVVSLSECTRCGHCTGLIANSTSSEWALRCERAREGSGAEVEADPYPDTVRSPALAELLQTPCRDVMSRNAICVPEDLGAMELLALLLERNISGVPVVDEHKRPIGIASKTDLLRVLYERGSLEGPTRIRGSKGAEYELEPGFPVAEDGAPTVRDIMMPFAFSVTESAPISNAISLMAMDGIHRVPVVSSRGEVVGLLSTLDVLRWLAQKAGSPVGRGPLLRDDERGELVPRDP